MALRWKMTEPERGLARVVAGPRSHVLREDGEKTLAMVSALSRHKGGGWYWVAGFDAQAWLPNKNTCDTPVGTVIEAKADAITYVREHMKRRDAAAKAP